MTDHTCGIDCKLISIAGPGAPRLVHEMYPSEATPHAGRYQHTINQSHDRRSYRASGQDETRNVRIWNLEFEGRKSRNFQWSELVMAGRMMRERRLRRELLEQI
jgi:hypothetical protein